MANFGDQRQLTRTEDFREYHHPPGKPQHGLRPPPEALQQDADVGVNLPRPGSSSNFEDDGGEGRKKTGLKEKIEDKLHDDLQGQQGDSPGPDGYTQQTTKADDGEKNGFMDKINEGLPGNH